MHLYRPKRNWKYERSGQTTASIIKVYFASLRACCAFFFRVAYAKAQVEPSAGCHIEVIRENDCIVMWWACVSLTTWNWGFDPSNMRDFDTGFPAVGFRQCSRRYSVCVAFEKHETIGIGSWNWNLRMRWRYRFDPISLFKYQFLILKALHSTRSFDPGLNNTRDSVAAAASFFVRIWPEVILSFAIFNPIRMAQSNADLASHYSFIEGKQIRNISFPILARNSSIDFWPAWVRIRHAALLRWIQGKIGITKAFLVIRYEELHVIVCEPHGSHNSFSRELFPVRQ